MRIGYINGLRGLCIIAVLWHHTMVSLLEGQGYPITVLGIEFDRFPVLTQLWKGVEFFFILSGFVLYLPYVTGERRFGSMGDTKRFYTHRANRLLPLFLFGFFVVFSLTHVYPTGSLRFMLELIGVPTLLFQFGNQGFEPPTFGPLWSVGVEILFSLLFPLLVLWRGRRSIFHLLTISFVLCLASEICEHFFLWKGFQRGLPYNLFNFMLGIAACEMVVNPQDFPRLLTALDRIAILLPLTFLLSLLLIDVANHQHSTLLHITANFLFSASAGAFITVLGTGRAETLRVLLEARWLQLLGAMCFSIYIWHLPIFFGLFQRTHAITWHQLETTGPIYLVLVFIVAALSYRYIEFPKVGFRSLFFLDRAEPASKPVAPQFVARAAPSGAAE